MAIAVQTSTATRTHALTRPLILWHLLSLDAPTVATLWTWSIARHSGRVLPISLLAATFLAVWILYAADRLLDTGAPASELEARHHFHMRYRPWFRLGLVAASLALAPLLLLLPPAAMRLYVELAAVLLAWFMLIHVPTTGSGTMPRRLPKELAVGLFFAAAVFIPTAAELPDHRLALVPLVLLFAALCSLNCLFIYAWEHPTPRSLDAAHPSTRFALRHLQALAFTVLASAPVLAIVQRSSLALAIALSTAFLLTLQYWSPRDPTLLRAAADLTLLTPLLVSLP